MNYFTAYQDTRTNNEDIALTPYLFGIKAVFDNVQAYGMGLCWLYWAFAIGLYFGEDIGGFHMRITRK